MPPPPPKLAWAVCATTLVAALAALPARLRPAVREVVVTPASPGVLPALCPPGSLPDESVCVPAPAPARSAAARGEGPPVLALLPGRAAQHARYRLPVAASEVRPASSEPAFGGDGGSPLPGAALVVPAGTPVVARALEGQQGAATVLFSVATGGSAPGPLVATYHVVKRGDAREAYVVLLGGFTPGELLPPRAALEDGAALGRSAGTPLYLEVRQLRPGVDPYTLTPGTVSSEATSVSTDLRNVYPAQSTSL